MTLDRLPYRTETFDARMRAFLRDVQVLCTHGSCSDSSSGGSRGAGATGRERSTSSSEATSHASSTSMTCAAAHTTTAGVDKDAGSVTHAARGSGSSRAASTTPAAAAGGFVWTGDLNVAERDYDRYFAGTYRSMQECSGFTPEERQSFRRTLHDTRAVDALRLLYPHAAPCYTFWSARINGRARNLGWRLDYFVVSASLTSHVVECAPMPDVHGSDHCPVQLWLRKL